MHIEVITCWYREHYLAPLFLQHYEPWVDQLTVITRKLRGTRPDGQPGDVLDDHVKMDWINDAVRRSAADWIVCVDADEFVFPKPYGTDPRAVLAAVPANCNFIIAEMNRVWTHKTDAPVDFAQPPVPQRLHGEVLPDGPHDYKKPCIFRSLRTATMANVTVGIGCHNLHGASGECPVRWGGAHWQAATPELRQQRRMTDRVHRLAADQYAWQIKYLPNEAEIESQAAAHLHDPVVIEIP